MKRFELKSQAPETPVKVIDIHVNRVIDGGREGVYTQEKVGTLIFRAKDGYGGATGPTADHVWRTILGALDEIEIRGEIRGTKKLMTDEERAVALQEAS